MAEAERYIGVGDNSLTKTAREKLKQLVSRIEKLNEEKQSIADDIKETYGEAKALGYDSKVIRECVKLRKQDRQEREEREHVLTLYRHALGDI